MDRRPVGITLPARPATSAPATTGLVRPLGPRPTLRGAAPFIAVGLLGVVITVISPHGSQGGHVWLVPASFAVALSYFAVSLRRSHRTWVDPLGPWLCFLTIMVARDVTGGSASPLGALVAIPTLYLALTGTRRDVWVSSGLTLVVFVAPILLIGPPLYSSTDWLLGLMWTLVTVFVAPAVHRVVRQVSRESARAREAHAEVSGVMRAAHLSSIIASDTSGTITSFSRGAELLLGHRAEMVVGAVRREALHDPQEIAAVAAELGVTTPQVFAELARRGAPPRTWAQLRADGTWAYVRLALTELRDDSGAVTGCLGIAIDSTASVEAERAVARSEATLRAVLQHLPDTTVLMVDDRGTIVAVGGEGALRQGFAAAEGLPLSSFVKPANLAVLAPLLESAFDGTEGFGELRGTRTDAPHEVTVTPLLPGEDEGPRALVIARDVSRERAHERQLLRAKQRAERLFSDAPYGVALLTPQGVVLDANEALCTLLGRPLESLRGSAFALAARPEDDTLEQHLRAAVLDPGARVEVDWSVVTRDGRDVHTLLSSRLLRDEDGEDLVLVNVVDVSERRRYEQRLAHLADHDVLTGLANRRRFDEELHRHLERCRRHGPTGALLMIDLDNFKEVNDTLGHAAGDELIRSTAELLRSRVRATDLVARLGGDEFAVLLADADRDAAESVARSIVERIREHTGTLGGTRRGVTASVGVVPVRTADDQEVDILALADMTMYDAKEAGRDGVVVLDDDSRQPRTGARMAWKRRIEDALENDAFELHLQPILDVRENAIHSAEVLLRLADTDELVAPGRFIEVAEQSGLMPQLDAWVVERSIALLASLRSIDPQFRLEVNLSGHSIGDERVERALVDGLRRHAVDPSALILEITETAAVADVELARQFADRMTALGCRFALDDFGAGFGSFYYLKHLLFDYVKIDGEFVANCHRSGIDRTILRSIVGIARDLGKQTVAEFVAEPEILEIVGAEGVDLAQGYDVGRPTSYDDFVERYLAGAVTAA